MIRLAQFLRAALSLSLVVLSPGLEAPRLFAQAIEGTAPVEGIVPVVGLSAAAPLSAPAGLSAALPLPVPSPAAPSVFAAAPALTSAAPAARAASVPELARALAPQFETAAKPDTSASGAVAAGRSIEDAITGGRSAGSGDVSSVAGIAGSGAPALSLSASVPAPAQAAPAAVPAAAVPAAGKVVDSAVTYRIHRFLLKSIAALTGGVYSLPVAGPALTRELIRSAADKSVVLSDFDDTLASYNQVLPPDMVEAVEAIQAAGKTFAVISDRGDEPRKNQLTVFDSLASLPVAARAGMYVAANSGGRVYRYDDKGEPVRVFEAPAPDAAEKAKLVAAVDATKARLKELGAELHFPSETNKVPTESWNVYSYAMMLKIGSTDAQVRGVSAILSEEMKKRGYDVQVDPRYAKDPTNPPYIVFSLVTKQTAAGFIANALKAGPGSVLVLGDSMYTPGVPKKESWLTRLGARLSGRALPRTGNRTDRNMELAVPGALTLSVGTSGDARASNLFVLAGKGPAVALEVLKSVASKPLAAPSAGDGKYLANPGAMYGEARKKAVALAAARGVPAEQVLFAGASASMPVRDGAHWHYAFSIPGKDGGRALIYADTGRFLGGALEVRTSLYENAPEPAGAKALEPLQFLVGTKDLDPEQALDAARRARPGMSGGVSVSLGGDLVYRFYDDRGAAVSVDPRTAEARVLSAIEPAASRADTTGRWERVKALIGPVAIVATAVASYVLLGHLMTEWLRQGEQQLRQQGPDILNNGALLGGTLGLAFAGTLRAIGKAKVGDDEISAAAKSVVAYKGGIWSKSEYDMGYSDAIANLRRRGASKAQLDLFRKLADEAPVIGGRFNPWSGD